MRIVQILPSMRRAGAETVTANLCQTLARLNMEIHLAVIGNRFEYQELMEIPSLQIHLLNLYHGPVRFYRWDIHRRIQRELTRFFHTLKPDIAHFHLSGALIWGGKAAFRAGANCFYTAHGLDPDLFPDNWRASYRRWLLLRALRDSQAKVLAVSSAVADHCTRGMPGQQITLQPNPLSLEQMAPPPTALWPRRIMMMGTLYPLKRVSVGLAAFLELSKTDPCEMWVVGDGPEKERLMTYAHQQGIGEHVTFLGERRDPLSLLRQVGMVWLLSEREGLPMVALEAMAAGVPLIATDAPGIRELVQHETNGLLVPLDRAANVANATRRVWTDPDLRHRIVTGGITTSQRFDPTLIAQHHLTHYRQGLTQS
ncbi:MAG: glycosyltransferase [Magnetococcus sp. YQC-5]